MPKKKMMKMQTLMQMVRGSPDNCTTCDLRIFPSNLAIVEVNQNEWRAVKEALAHVYKVLDPFFDIIWNGVETTGQLSCHFMREVDMSHMLAIFHDAHDASL